MERKRMAKGLSFILALTLCFGGNYAMPEVSAAETTADAVTESIRTEKIMEEQMYLEEECEYLEEPEDYSWMEKLTPSEDAVFFEEGAAERSENGYQDETEQTSQDMEVFREESLFLPGEQESDGNIGSGEEAVFDDGNSDTLFSSGPGEKPDMPIDSGSDEKTDTPIDSGSDEEPDTPADDDKDTELGESEATLHLEEGEDFITELNILLYKAKDLATDGHPYRVIIPPGNYEIKGTISMYSNIHLYAVGAVMKKVSTKKQILMRLGNSETSAGGYEGYRNITIEGGTWDCNYESCAQKEESGGFVCFRLGHATNITVKDAVFLNNLKSHFLEFGGVKHALVTGCRFEGYWTPHERSSQECIQIDACMSDIFPRYAPFDGTVCTDIVIENNIFQNVFAGAGSHSMMFDKPYTNIVIRGNKFRNVKRHSVWLLNCKDSVVSGNVMQNVGGGIYIASMRGTHVHFSEGQVPTIKQNQQSLNVTVSKNNITLAQTTTIAGMRWCSYGIWIGGQRIKNSSRGVPSGDYIIRGVSADRNVIQGPGHGIRLEKTISCRVSNNKLRLSKPAGYTNFGIYAGGSRNNQITGNTVEKSGNIGIYIYTNSNYTHKSTGNKLIGNQVKNGGSDGICIAMGSSSTVLQKNTVSGNKKNGIYVSRSGITSMELNKAVSNGKVGIYCSGSTIKEQKRNTFEGNKSVYAIQFYKCKGCVQNLHQPKGNTVRHTAKKITGTGAGGIRAYVYTKSNKRLASAKIGKKWSYSLPIKPQKKGTILSIRVSDKYGNVVRRQIKVR